MVGDGTLDLDHPVRHLAADEGQGLCLQLVFERHLLPRPAGPKVRSERDLDVKRLSATLDGAVNDSAPEPAGRVSASPRVLRPCGLVAGPDPIRGVPGGHPDTEHLVVERGEGTSRAAAARVAVVPPARRPVGRATGAPHPVVRGLPGQGAEGPGVSRLPGPRVPGPGGRAAPGGGFVAAAPAAGRSAASAPRPRTALPSTRPASPSSWWTPTRAGSSLASATCAGARAMTRCRPSSHARCPPTRLSFGDYHAQIVRLAKEACRTRPLCARCPLDRICPKRLV